MSTNSSMSRVVVSLNGPYLVTGKVALSTLSIGVDSDGGSETWVEGKALPAAESYALCRCGESRNKPFCDGTHLKIGFDGTETATREPYSTQAKVFDGPTLSMLDSTSLCASARFCDSHGQVWNQVEHTNEASVRATFIRQVADCPSGRLVARDNATGKTLEPKLPISIGLVEDPEKQCSGPLWLRGGIPVIAVDGFAYEVRNRVTLCRCGQSKNKPYCDGSHEPDV